MVRSVEELYGDVWGTQNAEFEGEIGRSLEPSGGDVLYEVFGTLGVGAGATVLDVGSRNAKYAVELVRRFGCRVIAVDPIPLHAELAAARVAEAGMGDWVRVVRGGIEALPLGTATVDHVWCRDVLNHVDLPRGLAECHRVLKPGGTMLVYQTFATDGCEPREAGRLYAALAIVPENMSTEFFETTARSSGFDLLGVDQIDSEWREHSAEGGDRVLLDDLLRVARMRRRQDDLVARFGSARYEAEYAGYLWGIYQMLGKLCPTVYTLRRTGG